MVHRVHHHAAVVRHSAKPARTARLADLLVHVIRVGHRADRGHALGPHHAQFAGLEFDLRIAGVLADQLRIGARGARDLAAGAGLHLDVVDDRANRDRRHRHGVARLDIGPCTGHHGIARAQPLRCQDIGQLAVLVLDQRDERRAVRIVLQPLHRGRHVDLAPLEVDLAVRLLVSAATESAGDAAVVVAPARAGLAGGQALDRLALPQIRAVDQHRATQAGGDRIEILHRHRCRSPPLTRARW